MPSSTRTVIVVEECSYKVQVPAAIPEADWEDWWCNQPDVNKFFDACRQRSFIPVADSPPELAP